MNQTHIDRVREARKKRREYVAKKASLSFYRYFGVLLAVIFGGLTLLYAIDDWNTDTAHLIRLTLFAVVFRFGVWYWTSCTAEAKALPFVPPVAKQIAALPANEILVRGSDGPISAPEELLRAAHTGIGEQANELLRADKRMRVPDP